MLVLLVLNFVFASTPCPRGRKGEGGRFVCKVWWWLWIYISSSREVQETGSTAPSSAFYLWSLRLLEIVGKQERRSCFFTFLDYGPILSEGPPGGGREGCWHAYTHIHIHIRQPVSCEDWSLTAPSGVCMCVCMFMCMYVWNNAKMIECNVLCPAVFLFRREEGWNEDVLIARPLLPQNGKLLRGELALSLSLPLSPSLSVCRSVLSFLFSDT